MQDRDDVPDTASFSADLRGLTFGVDVGGTKVLGVALDSSGAVVGQARAATPLSPHERRNGSGAADSVSADPTGGISVNPVIDAISEVVAQLTAGLAAQLGTSHIPPLGVGIPGLVDDDGTMHFAPNLPAGAGVDFKALVTKATGGRRVVVDNDATCAALGEWTLGAAAGASDAIMVTLGTGIGAGIIADGALLHGANGYAGEAGHMVVDPSGPLCSCGRRGCWERYASGSGLARLSA